MNFDERAEESRDRGIKKFDEDMEKLSRTEQDIEANLSSIEQKQDDLTKLHMVRRHLIEVNFSAYGRVHLYVGVVDDSWSSLCGIKTPALHLYMDKINFDSLEAYEIYSRCRKCWEHPNYDLVILGNTSL